MRSQTQLHQVRRNHRGWLYSVVFTGRVSLAVVVLLFLSFFIQPFHQALANEAAAIEKVLPDDVTEQLPNVAIEPVEEVPMESSVETITETDGTGSVSVEEQQLEATDTEEVTVLENLEPELGTESGLEEQAVLAPTTTEDTPDIATTTAGDGSTTATTESVDEDGGISEAIDETTSPTPAEEVTTSPVADVTSGNTTDEDELIDGAVIKTGVNDLVDSVVKEVVTLTRQMVTEENYFQFSKQSCVAVGDGTYHCTSKERASIDPDSAVYAEQDASGDMEIYMRTSKGEVKQLTDNNFDDTSPDMDLASMRVVWQRLIDGRYQIISLDLESREETQLTFSKNNSMEPKVSDEGIVWQAWDGADWEIMFFDGKVTDQITNNENQDVTPIIEDGYVLWSLLGGETSEARVYSIESGETMTIAGHEGGAVVNPRFVLVYDTKFDNGDVITQGFDPVTGLAQPIAAKPAALPDLPEPDPIGEIRALIQNKATSKDKEVITVPVSSGGNDLNLATSSATTSAITLDLNAQDDGTAILPVLNTEPEFQLGEYDLVITPEASSTTSVLNSRYYDNGTTTINMSLASTTRP